MKPDNLPGQPSRELPACRRCADPEDRCIDPRRRRAVGHATCNSLLPSRAVPPTRSSRDLHHVRLPSLGACHYRIGEIPPTAGRSVDRKELEKERQASLERRRRQLEEAAKERLESEQAEKRSLSRAERLKLREDEFIPPED